MDRHTLERTSDMSITCTRTTDKRHLNTHTQHSTVEKEARKGGEIPIIQDMENKKQKKKTIK